MDSPEGSANDAMTAEIDRRVNKAVNAQQMRNKIELDARYISSNADIWYFINSCLDSRPQQVIATFYAAGGPGGPKDSVEFLKYLDRTYKDLNTDLQAAITLRTLRQRDDQSLSSFLPWFERTLAEAGGAD
ncbi:hypothetical protein CGCA056_v009430 [Colletotrichum aenigma]|uniref:uncharacterized protein n=1 Tax=Colletotrichum aenigma TaxID=1215731 RepID=UPI0018723C53|nr:uncharacterized protein CGCA056_v009430 [Colletotrichum aenigma]KAF5519573.1 hypothetical protein CGCA056_v009430 [Colletotrichum aenigma]